MSDLISAQGQEYALGSAEERNAIIEAAFEYRGDVTVHLQTGENVEGYLFNREKSSDGVSSITLLSKGSDQPRSIKSSEIERLTFSGKDPADGKSYEAWRAKKESERATEAKKVEEEMRSKGYL